MEPWVLIRGLSRQQQHWGEFPLLLAEQTQREVWFEDLPGFGTRNHLPSPRSIEEIGEFVANALSLRHEGKVNLIGLSLGGMVALDIARQQPAKVNRLVMINSSFKPLASLFQRLQPSAYPGFLKALLHPLAAGSERQILELSSNLHRHDQVVLRNWLKLRQQQPPSKSAVLNQIVAASRYRFHGPKPVEHILLIASTMDRIVHPICSEHAAAALAADLISHPYAGHDLPLDAPDWLAETIAAWVNAAG